MDSGSIQPVMPVGGDGLGSSGNAFIWIFGLLILMSMFNGGWGNNRQNMAISSEVQRGFDAQNSAANEREILSAVSDGAARTTEAVNQNFHDTIQFVSDKYSELQRDVGNLAVGQAQNAANSQRCCGELKQLVTEKENETQRQISQNNYDAAMRDAATNANLAQQIQSVKDMIQQNKIDALQQQVQQLQMAQATNGMLKFPNSWTYGAGAFPPIFGGCCGQQNNI